MKPLMWVLLGIAWAMSWLLLFAGIGTIEWAVETGEGSALGGLALVAIWLILTYLVCFKYADKVEKAIKWFGLDN